MLHRLTTEDFDDAYRDAANWRAEQEARQMKLDRVQSATLPIGVIVMHGAMNPMRWPPRVPTKPPTLLQRVRAWIGCCR